MSKRWINNPKKNVLLAILCMSVEFNTSCFYIRHEGIHWPMCGVKAELIRIKTPARSLTVKIQHF